MTTSLQTPPAVESIGPAGQRRPALLSGLPIPSTPLFGRERDAAAVRDLLIGALRDRQTLIVLDNAEHLAEAFPQIADLLAGCPALRLLVTSRVRLQLSDEQECPITPLPLPSVTLTPEGAADAPAVALFAERARAARPSFALTAANTAAVVQICRRLDGLPLALELAAARIAHLSPAALLDRLDRRFPLLTGGPRDAPERHRTMRDAIGWSVDLLDDAGRTLFARLAVFAGSFSLEAAEAVASAQEPVPSARSDGPRSALGTGHSVLDGIASLLDKSLLRRVDDGDGEPRYAMLETIREYAAELLTTSGEADMVAARLAAWLADLNDRAAAGIRGPDQAAWLARLDAEQANIRAMTTWALAREDAEMALRLTTKAIWFYWETRGLVREEARLLTRAIEIAEQAPDRVDPTWLARGYIAHGMRLVGTGDYDLAQRRLEDAVAAFRQTGDQAGLATAVSNLASVLSWRGDGAGARPLFEEAIAIRRTLGDPRAFIPPLLNLASTTTDEGDLTAAQAMLDEAAPHAEQFGEQRDRAFLRYFRGQITVYEGRTGEAREILSSARSLLREIPDIRGVAICATHLALALHKSGDLKAAAEALIEALTLARDVDDRPITQSALDVLAGALLDAGQAADAARMLGAAAALRTAMDVAIRPLDLPRWTAMTRRAETALGPEPFATAERAGRLLSMDDAMSEGITLATAFATMEQPVFVETTDPMWVNGQRHAPLGGGPAVRLTSREQAVLRLLVEGHSDREIADQLSISPRTASSHVANILAKFDVPTRTAATAFALRERLV